MTRFNPTLYADHEAANAAAAAQYNRHPTMDIPALIGGAIDTVVDEKGSFTIAEVRPLLDPDWPPPSALQLYVGRLVQGGVLVAVGDKRQKRFHFVVRAGATA